MRCALLAGSIALLAAHSLQAAPKTHRLEITPGTVAYGYYWSEAQPVLRIASGDIVDVDTMLTNTPEGLRRAGRAEEQIQASLRAVVEAGAGRTHRHRPDLCRGRAAGRRTRSECAVDRPGARLRLQRLQRISAGELRPGAAGKDHSPRSQEDDG